MNKHEQKLQTEIDEIKKDIEAIILVQYQAYQRMDEVIGIIGKLVGVGSQTTGNEHPIELEGGEEDGSKKSYEKIETRFKETREKN